MSSSQVEMKEFRTRLEDLSKSVPSLNPSINLVSLMTFVSPNVLAMLAPSDDPSLYLISLLPSYRSSASSRVKIVSLPQNFSSAHKVLPAEGLFAIIASTGICVCDAPSAHNLNIASPLSLASSLFESHPGLRIKDAGWSPAASGFLLVLTSDWTIRLYDVVSKRSAATERMCLRVISTSAPVSFAFGRGSCWEALSVYILAEDGSIYVASPIAPVGTRIPLQSWQLMLGEANAVISREQTTDTGIPIQKTPPAGENRTLRRTLDFSSLDDDKEAPVQSWALKQARLQKIFLETVFAETSSTDMIATREFKPAPLLFQGPLYTEHDDLNETDSEEQHPPFKFRDLTLLHCGMERPTVLMRTAENGEVSVLIGLEKVEAQWFLSNGAGSFLPNGTPHVNEEYTECARAVAPLLLCFEHLSFGNPVMFFPLGQETDADVLYALTSTSIFSVRLSFISALCDPETLESIPKSTIAELFSIWSPEASGRELARNILGIAPWYATGQGPVAIVLSSDGTLHASDPLRWVTDFDASSPPRINDRALSSEGVWTTERPLTGPRAFAIPKYGKEMVQLLRVIRDLEGEYGGRVAIGTLGKVRDVQSYSSVVKYLDGRLESIVGGSNSAGVADNLKALTDVLDQWSADLLQRADRDANGIQSLREALLNLERSQNSLNKKLSKVKQNDLKLKGRIQLLMRNVQASNSKLSDAESAWYKRLREKKSNLLSIGDRIGNLETSINNTVTNTHHKPLDHSNNAISSFRSPRSAFSRSKVSATSPFGTGSPFAKRKSQRSPGEDRVDLSRHELEQIRSTLVNHSKDIGTATELSDKLWRQLATS
eukprot:GFKZ01008316.1.p1 GENE.GFKZ01008316.1~~GFKZ01008316.1.p1  ORF type:complete len:830 (+),score=82.91 GFKZ01008316.1:137-2626(+)